jgi:DNA/RNA endonuclease G (NUC1)
MSNKKYPMRLPSGWVKERIPTPNLKNNKVRRREAKWRKDMDRLMAINALKDHYTGSKMGYDSGNI